MKSTLQEFLDSFLQTGKVPKNDAPCNVIRHHIVTVNDPIPCVNNLFRVRQFDRGIGLNDSIYRFADDLIEIVSGIAFDVNVLKLDCEINIA